MAGESVVSHKETFYAVAPLELQRPMLAWHLPAGGAGKAVQILGGCGYMRESPAGPLVLDGAVRAWETLACRAVEGRGHEPC